MFGLKTILLAFVLGGSAVAFSMQGLGGGVLYTPIQVFFGVDFYEAATRSQLLIIVTSISSTLIFRKAGKIDWPLALMLEPPALVGGYLGGFYAQRFSEEGLLLVLALLVMMASLSMLRELPPSQTKLANGSQFGLWRRRHSGYVYGVNLVQGLPIFFLIGVFSGLAGVAGGFLKTPVMALLFRMPMDVILGSSAFMVSFTAAGGLFGHLAAGSWDLGSTLLLAAFVALGAQVGPRLTLKDGPKRLQQRFGYFLLLVAGIILFLALHR